MAKYGGRIKLISGRISWVNDLGWHWFKDHFLAWSRDRKS